MAHPVVRFEIGCSDKEETERFYADTFGWGFADNGPYSRNIESGAEGGLPGAITSLGHEPHQYVMIYIQVENVSAAVEAINANGGTVQVGPRPTLDDGEFAWAKDPEGNRFAVVSGGL